MAFTTWAALKSEMLDDLASGRWKIKEYRVGEVFRTFATVDEFMSMFKFVESRAAEESSTAPGRTYAAQGGGGRW